MPNRASAEMLALKIWPKQIMLDQVFKDLTFSSTSLYTIATLCYRHVLMW
jgi:hypothetical protein